MKDKKQTIWLLLDGRKGNESQLMGIADYLEGQIVPKQIHYTFGIHLPNFLRFLGFLGITKDCFKNLSHPYPDLILSAGRRSYPIACYIKKKSNLKTKIVHLMNPNGHSDFADLLILPTHDQKKEANNILTITGAPHQITASILEKAKEHFQSLFTHFLPPRVSVMVGGATKDKPFTLKQAQQLVDGILALNPKSILITTSRRTPKPIVDYLKRSLTDSVFFYEYGNQGENPYFGLLSWGDKIVVTGDSIAMCSEACATGKPVYIFAPKKMMTKKHRRFHLFLYKNNYAAPLNSKVFLNFKPLKNPAEVIAHSLAERFKIKIK